MNAVKKGKELYHWKRLNFLISSQDNYYFQKECTTIDKA
ncbi:hypothetical protein DFO70_107345 [Cytobacillus firmus]|uniref:Uncharacterized protein n=2 Tax=Cytobacillus TaxID=2675230 RepID=A0A366JVF1_CYTFI|nr:hypothetical protein DFO70_107345 [Cytobacillus firmus]TDX41906.1 hypothetical protein DFO72_10765 [Cytobacillus oceanisediminis]